MARPASSPRRRSIAFGLAVATACSGGAERTAPVEQPLAPVGYEHAGTPPRFEDYPVAPDASIRPVPVDLSSHPEAREFRTVLSRGAAQGPNFAGHYTLVSWGCGTQCHRAMIVDALTGRVLSDLMAPLGFEYRADSRLIVANPPDDAGEASCPACQTTYHLWGEDERLFVIPPSAWRGETPPPLQQRALVAWFRAAEEPRLPASLEPAVVRAAWDRLVITTRDGARHVFADEGADDEVFWIHVFAGHFPELDAYVVEKRYVPEGREFLFVEAASGRISGMDAPPVPSPDRTRFATASLDLVAGHERNRIRIYRLEAGRPTVEWEIEPREWGARSPEWLDAHTLRLERAVVDWSTHELLTSPMLLRLQNGRWSAEFSSGGAQDVLRAFFRALSVGYYMEATQYYGGSYEQLRTWNPELDPADLPSLWRAACEGNGLVCMGDANVVRAEQSSPSEIRFVVRFRTDRGEPFVLGPCCGETEEGMQPVSEFAFGVRRVGERYLVQDLPVYVP